MIGFRTLVAAFAVALAASAVAQETGTLGDRIRKQREQQARPAPAPAAPQAGGQQAQQGQAGQLSEDQRAALGGVRAHNELMTRAGEIAASRGSSQEVRDLGKQLADEHRQVDGELTELVKARGADLKSLPASGLWPQLDSQVKALSDKSGEEFDRDFVAFMTQNGNTFVEALKRARDVTPGKDSQLKKWLDDAENLEEGYLARSRETKQRRQARTPPAR
jgi:putative membrane protein